MNPLCSSEFIICDTAPLVTERNRPMSVGPTFEELLGLFSSMVRKSMNSARLISCFPSTNFMPKPELASFLNLNMVCRSSIRSSSSFVLLALSVIGRSSLIFLYRKELRSQAPQCAPERFLQIVLRGSTAHYFRYNLF